MGKKETYYPLAERMYVEEQKSASAIAQKLNLTEKTIGAWKKEGGWDEKRRKFLNSQYACYAGLYELLNKISAKTIEEFNQTGEVPDKSTMSFISKMIDKLPKLKTFEAEQITEKLQAEKSDVSGDILESVDRFLRGG